MLKITSIIFTMPNMRQVLLQPIWRYWWRYCNSWEKSPHAFRQESHWCTSLCIPFAKNFLGFCLNYCTTTSCTLSSVWLYSLWGLCLTLYDTKFRSRGPLLEVNGRSVSGALLIHFIYHWSPDWFINLHNLLCVRFCSMLPLPEGMRFEFYTVLKIQVVVFRTTWYNNPEYPSMNMLIMFPLYIVWLPKKMAQSCWWNVIHISLFPEYANRKYRSCLKRI
jgi:hypothetical protein